MLVTATTLLIYGGTRMRSGAEPAIAVFAAYGLVEALRAARGRWGRSQGERTPTGSLGTQ